MQKLQNTKQIHHTNTQTNNRRQISPTNENKNEKKRRIQKKRSNTIETPFGTLKTFYNINQTPSIGKHHTRNTRSIPNNIQT